MNQILFAPAPNFSGIPIALRITSISLLTRHSIFWTTSISPASFRTIFSFLTGCGHSGLLSGPHMRQLLSYLRAFAFVVLSHENHISPDLRFVQVSPAVSPPQRCLSRPPQSKSSSFLVSIMAPNLYAS